MLEPSGQDPKAEIDWGSLRGKVEGRMRGKWPRVPASDIEDAAQEAIIIVDSKIAGGETINSPLAMATAAANNKLQDRYRQRLRRETPLEDEVAESLPSKLTPVEDEVVDRMAVQAILDCLPFLPKSQQEVLILHYAEAQSYRQISAKTGLSLASVKQNLHRAREKIRNRLGINI